MSAGQGVMLAFGILLGSVPALAGPCMPGASDGRVPGLVGLQLENDLFGSGTDRHYTHGTRLSVLAPPECIPDVIRDGVREIPTLDREDTFTFLFSLGQNIYTPEDITAPDPDPADRPYAGWTYVSIGAVAEDRETGLLHNVALDVGVVGPWALAGETQDLVHHLIDAPIPRGWGHQLNNEPGVILTYQAQMRLPLTGPESGLGVDITPRGGVALGNVFTYGAVGASVRVGHNLELDYGAPLIRPSLPGGLLVRRRDSFGWYLFAGVEGRAVARNIFLDGNTFGDGPSVDKKTLIGDLQFGASLIWDRVRLSYTQILRTPEFANQRGNDQFGSLSLSLLF